MTDEEEDCDGRSPEDGVMETVAAALSYNGRGIDYYDPVTNTPVTLCGTRLCFVRPMK